MRILFVENRYSTYLWNAVAKELLKAGHEIFWIVQNREFMPDTGTIFTLNTSHKPIPASQKVYDSDIQKVLKADRGINYFGVRSDDHLFSVQAQVSEIVNKIKPEIGFGECTLHHEMITMHIFKRNGIPYLFPTSCRYPVNRFSFYLYDSLVPFGGSGEDLGYKDALQMANHIADRSVKPQYMAMIFDNPPQKTDKFFDRIKVLKGYLKGEKYNTPGILTKLRLKNISKRNRKLWDSFAQKKLAKTDSFKILYPMQMQPEASIDVWGTAFNNQFEIVRNILTVTDADIQIVVKPNPTSSLEINEQLIHLAKTDSRILPLHHSVKMDEILTDIDFVITVTGTIALECIFANKPVATLVNSFFNTAENCLPITDYTDIPGIIKSIQEDRFPQLSDTEKVRFLNYLNKVSFDGTISCTFWQKDVTNPINMGKLNLAFQKIIQTVKDDWEY